MNLGERFIDAAMIETDTISNKFHQADEFGFCPECGAVMDEADRLDEGECTYILLECSKSNCDGQRLHKETQQPLFGSMNYDKI